MDEEDPLLSGLSVNYDHLSSLEPLEIELVNQTIHMQKLSPRDTNSKNPPISVKASLSRNANGPSLEGIFS